MEEDLKESGCLLEGIFVGKEIKFITFHCTKTRCLRASCSCKTRSVCPLLECHLVLKGVWPFEQVCARNTILNVSWEIIPVSDSRSAV